MRRAARACSALLGEGFVPCFAGSSGFRPSAAGLVSATGMVRFAVTWAEPGLASVCGFGAGPMGEGTMPFFPMPLARILPFAVAAHMPPAPGTEAAVFPVVASVFRSSFIEVMIQPDHIFKHMHLPVDFVFHVVQAVVKAAAFTVIHHRRFNPAVPVVVAAHAAAVTSMPESSGVMHGVVLHIVRAWVSFLRMARFSHYGLLFNRCYSGRRTRRENIVRFGRFFVHPDGSPGK